MSKLPLVKPYEVIMGCDPEFFFIKNGKVIGSEKVIPEEGIQEGKEGIEDEDRNKITRDGIQAELNPRADFCRQTLANNISWCFRKLRDHIPTNISINLNQNAKITKVEMDSLSYKSKQFGCLASTNFYDKNFKIPIRDASKFYSRCAGGHIHLSGDSKILNKVLGTPKTIIPLLDLLVGNTCVLIDRDKSNITRRKLYGRAGEYRIHPGRIEYRTLSNFWLKDYVLFSFVTGMARFAVEVAATGLKHSSLLKAYLSKVKPEDVVRAINSNSFRLAKKNFNAIKPIIMKTAYQNAPLNKNNILKFELFVKRGINHWFWGNPISNWTNGSITEAKGWERFLNDIKT